MALETLAEPPCENSVTAANIYDVAAGLPVPEDFLDEFLLRFIARFLSGFPVSVVEGLSPNSPVEGVEIVISVI